MRNRILLLLCLLVCLFAQTRRSAYQQAFQTWQQTGSNLENDAASAGTGLAPRANRAAAAAAEYGSTRIGFLRAASGDLNQRALAVKAASARPFPDLAPAGDLTQIVSSENKFVTTTIATFATDPDRGIQQLRLALERERAALTALSGAISDRQKAEAKTAQASAALDSARAKAGDEYGKLSFGLAQSAAQVEKESSAWASYYQKLAAASVGSAPGPVSSAVAPVTPGTATPPVSLARYVGGWMFPSTNGQSHGALPQSVDLTVHEEKGHVTGTLIARFKLPAGSAGDPALRFDFDGQWQATATQTFPLITSDGTKGTIDLIPGPAFNLLEVNFQTEPKPGKIRLGNFILLKK
jgi:hypothetical protein